MGNKGGGGKLQLINCPRNSASGLEIISKNTKPEGYPQPNSRVERVVQMAEH